ncbi:hypothetical protein Acr_00g0055930 [Actinidia rufa]|uniref:Uncharacterized protein n=1 Tax=Actinidia rufa TaxID=165716 RepID=A0A7J0DP34_9ERIC|nr:hypothetical protein Acr_00g0055930 [Actinidia rufa]
MMNRSSSEWAFQRFLQEAHNTTTTNNNNNNAASNSSPPPSSSFSASACVRGVPGALPAERHDDCAVEIKDHQPQLHRQNENPNPTMSINLTPPNVPVDSEEYQAFLKSRLKLACAAVALTRDDLRRIQLLQNELINPMKDFLSSQKIPASNEPCDLNPCCSVAKGAGKRFVNVNVCLLDTFLVEGCLPVMSKNHGEYTGWMSSRAQNAGRARREAQREYLIVPRTPGERGTKLLADAQRVAKGPSGQRPSQIDMVELRKVLLAKNLKMLTPRAGERSFEVRAVRRKASPWGGSRGKQALSYYDEAESQSGSKTVALGRQRAPPS